MYKAYLFHPEGDYVTDCKSEDLETTRYAVANLGSKWIFYPIVMIVDEQGTIVETAYSLEHWKGEQITDFQQHLQEVWQENADEVCDVINNGDPLHLLY